MSDYTVPGSAAQSGDSTVRLSNAERDDAVGALARALADGRITTDEFTSRSATAKAATTRADLQPLFADLPPLDAGVSASSSGPAPDPDLAPPAAFVNGDYSTSVPPSSQYGPRGRGGPLGGSTGTVIMSIMPFIALVLFFASGWLLHGWAWSWLWFILVPVTGIIVYGPGGRRRNY
jgi:hypothetical protein